MTTGTVIAITASGLAVVAIGYGLYRLGKNVQLGNIKVKRPIVVEDIEGKVEYQPIETSNKVTVDFVRLSELTFEEIVKWINTIDIPDAESENLVCHLVRYGKELMSYDINLSDLSDDEIKHIVVAHVMDEKTHKIYSSKWIIADKIDTDLSETFGSYESINLK